MKIGIVAYVDYYYDGIHFVNEANLMTYSGRDLDDRFEFVLFTHPLVIDKITPRRNVRVVPYCVGDPLGRPRNDLESFYFKLPFAKSIRFVKDNEKILMEYDYIIKTDTDVFFTPTLNEFKFSNKITTGLGMQLHFGEVEENFIAQLKDLAINKLGKKSYDYYGRIFTTTIGKPAELIKVFNEADHLSKIIFEEHTDPNTQWNDGLFQGISTMYATEIVLCSKYPRHMIDINDKFDAPSDPSQIPNPKPWNYYAQFHCRHDETGFSKFLARRGAYDNADYLHDNSITSYCLNTYLDFKKTERYYSHEEGQAIMRTADARRHDLYQRYSQLATPLAPTQLEHLQS